MRNYLYRLTAMYFNFKSVRASGHRNSEFLIPNSELQKNHFRKFKENASRCLFLEVALFADVERVNGLGSFFAHILLIADEAEVLICLDSLGKIL